MSTEKSRYVYLYSAVRTGVVVYVGRGDASRPTDHDLEDDNPGLAQEIRNGGCLVSVIDCGSNMSAEVVEGALISAGLDHTRFDLSNRRKDKHQFTPLGVPQNLAGRASLDPLTPQRIANNLRRPVLFVRTGPRNLADPERGVINPARPEPWAIADRLCRDWQMVPWLKHWRRYPQSRPVALVGIAGTRRRYVSGAIDLRKFNWADAEVDGGYVAIPCDGPTSVFGTSGPTDTGLDAFELRGRGVLNGRIFNQGAASVQVFTSRGKMQRPPQR